MLTILDALRLISVYATHYMTAVRTRYDPFHVYQLRTHYGFSETDLNKQADQWDPQASNLSGKKLCNTAMF